MNKTLLTLSVLLAGSALSTSALAAPVTITYWQYDYASKVTEMNALIKKFQAANPDITVKQENFPYDAYNQTVATSVPITIASRIDKREMLALPSLLSSNTSTRVIAARPILAMLPKSGD